MNGFLCVKFNADLREMFLFISVQFT